jgi:hypothetical protein
MKRTVSAKSLANLAPYRQIGVDANRATGIRNRAEILACIERAGDAGVQSSEIRKIVGLSHESTRVHCAAMRKDGLVKTDRKGGKYTRWFLESVIFDVPKDSDVRKMQRLRLGGKPVAKFGPCHVFEVAQWM